MDQDGHSAVELELRPHGAVGFAGLVTLVGEHDMATCHELADALVRVDGDVLVDLSRCTFIDSSVIDTLLARAGNIKRDGYRLELFVPPENEMIARILDIVHASSVVVVHETWPRHASSGQG